MDAQPTIEELLPCLSVRTLGAEAVVIATGEFDLASTPAVAAVFTDVMIDTCRRVVIDLSGVTFLDAAGLRALRAESTPAGRAIKIRFRAPSRPVRRLLELVDMCELIEGAPPGDGRGCRRTCNATTHIDAEGD